MRSENELELQLDDSVTLSIGGGPEVRGVHLECVLIEAEGEIRLIGEGPQRVVQPVVPIDAELKRLRLGDAEVLEDSHIPVEERWSVNGWDNVGAVLADHRRRAETGGVDVLVRPKACPRVTRNKRLKP